MDNTEKASSPARNIGNAFSTSPTHPPFDKSAENRLLRTLDMRVLPILWLLFLVCFIDRSNIGNAKILGMDTELDLKGQRYNIAVFVFNLGYLVAGVPFTILVKRLGPRTLSIMMLCWGVMVIGCGVTKSWEGLVVCRLLEGMAEAAYVPGAAYMIGSYYKRDEFLRRYVVFFSAGSCGGAVYGFLSSLIAKMDGLGGYQAWRWIFIIEGCLTIAVSVTSYVFIVPFPEDSAFLSADDKALLLARLKADSGRDAQDKLQIKQVLTYLRDWKIWAAVLTYVGGLENANSITNFQPTVLKGLGYTATQAQVHTIPVYVCGSVYSISLAYLAEYLGKRYLFCTIGFCTIIIGLLVQIIEALAPGVRYMGLFFIAAGAYLVMPITVVWITINVQEGYKRSVALGAVVCFANAGSFISSNVFLKREEPIFRTGFGTSLGLTCMGMLAATVLFFGMRMENKQKDGVVASGHTDHNDTQERHTSDRYCL